MPELTPGMPAPDFALTDQHGEPVRLADLGPRRALIYFYPAALTPGCTIEAIDFSGHLDEFRAAGVSIVGVSPDPVERLLRFTEVNRLRVRLLSDPSRETIEAYGAWGVKTLYGRQVAGVVRSTVVVDVAADGAGTVVFADYNVRAKGHVDRMLARLVV